MDVQLDHQQTGDLGVLTVEAQPSTTGPARRTRPRSRPSAAATTPRGPGTTRSCRPGRRRSRRTRLPAQLGAQLGRVDRVAQVVAGPVGDLVVRVARPAEQDQDRLHHLPVVALPVGPDQVGLADPALLGDQQHRGGVVVGVDPVADVGAGAVELGPAAVEHVGDLPRDELLHVLVRPVVVGAVADRGLHAERAHPGPDQQVRAGLGRGVGAGRVVRRGLGEPLRVVQLQVAVHLVGGDVVVADPVPADRLEQRVGADQVGAARTATGRAVSCRCGTRRRSGRPGRAGRPEDRPGPGRRCHRGPAGTGTRAGRRATRGCRRRSACPAR